MAPNQIGHLIHFVVDHAIIFETGNISYKHCEPEAVAFPARPRHALLARVLVIWQAMGVYHILEKNVQRVAQ